MMPEVHTPSNTEYHSYSETVNDHDHYQQESSAYYESASNHHQHDHHDGNGKHSSSSLNKFLHESDQSDELHYTVREYLTNRRRRNVGYGMCCLCFGWCDGLLGHCVPKKILYHLSSCCLRIPVIDLVNENVFYRFVVWFLFARLYFSAIYSTRVWQWFSDDRMDAILGTCDFIGDTSGAATISLIIGFILSVAVLNNAVQMSFWKRFCTLVIAVLAMGVDIGETAYSINCYHKSLFSIRIEPRSYPYLNPGQTNFTFVNVTELTESPREFLNFLNATSKNMIYNIQLSQYQFISAFLILQWILAFGSIAIVTFLLISAIVQSSTKFRFNNWFNFYNHRLSRYYYHVRALLRNISKRKVKRSFAYYANKNTLTGTSAVSTSLSSLDTDEIEDRLEEKLERYWENKKKSLLRRIIVVPFLKLKYYGTLKWIRLKRAAENYSREKWSNFFFPSRFIIGISSALLISFLILGTFSAFSVHVMYSAINIIYLLLTAAMCIFFTRTPDSCQASITKYLIPVFKVIEANYYLTVAFTIITMLFISVLIARNYKQHMDSYRNGNLQFSLKSQSIIKASNYPGLQAAHYAVATAVYFFIIYAILLIIGFFFLFFEEIFLVIGFLIQNGLEILLRIISFFAGKIITVLIVFILRFIFLRKKGTWLVHTNVFGIMDLLLIVANYFYGFLTAVVVSTAKTLFFALINYVRLDSPSNPAFYAYAGMLKADTHHADPIINVFADILKKKAREKEEKLLQTLQEDPKVTLNELKSKSNTFQQPKLKNYLKLIALLSKNQQLAQNRTSMTSEFFDEESYEIKRIKFLKK